MTPAAAFIVLSCAWLLSICLIVFPVVRFLRNGWELRRGEFINRLSRGCLEPYLARYGDAAASKWALEQIERRKSSGVGPADLSRAATAEEIRLFSKAYDRIIGKRTYVFPLILLGLIAAVSLAFVTGASLAISDDAARLYRASLRASAMLHPEQGTIPLVLNGVPAQELAGLVFGDTYLHLLATTAAAVSGAYLWVTANVVQSCRSRSLVYSDLLFASLRLLVAAPVGLSVASLVRPSLAPFLAFAIGAFPIAQLSAILQRLALGRLNAAEMWSGQEKKQLVAMDGVTSQVADVLMAEGIGSPQQLAENDPVTLALRSGLSFDFVVLLSAQAMVWTYFGPTTILLARVGLGDARAVHRLVRGKPRADATTLMEDVKAATGKPISVLALGFERIAEDDYTQFLVSISGDEIFPPGAATSHPLPPLG